MAYDTKPSFWAGLRWPVKAIIIALPIVGGIWAASKFDMIPGLKTDTSKEIKKSVIGNRSRIGEGTVIENSYIMGNDFYQSLSDMKDDIENKNQLIGIGERCFINHALVDKNCRIGNDVYINGGKHLANCSEELYCIKDGIVVVKKGTVLPDNFRIE